VARDTSFYYSFLVLPADQRRAIVAVWDFCRAVDDAVDETDGRRDGMTPREAVAFWRAELARAYGAGEPQTPQGRGLLPFVAAFDLPRQAFEDVIDGVAMDLDKTRYETFEELLEYCRRVASAVGLICIRIFGCQDPAARRYAIDLGVALQLTNILRDVREDAENGRIYLPGEDLRRFGVDVELDGDGAMERSAGRLAKLAAEQGASLTELVRFEAERAERWFDRGLLLVPQLDRRSAACVSAMAGIYHRLLERIEADPAAALRSRTSLSGAEKVRVALRSIVGRGA
jgi:phytoene synthase